MDMIKIIGSYFSEDETLRKLFYYCGNPNKCITCSSFPIGNSNMEDMLYFINISAQNHIEKTIYHVIIPIKKFDVGTYRIGIIEAIVNDLNGNIFRSGFRNVCFLHDGMDYFTIHLIVSTVDWCNGNEFISINALQARLDERLTHLFQDIKRYNLGKKDRI